MRRTDTTILTTLFTFALVACTQPIDDVSVATSAVGGPAAAIACSPKRQVTVLPAAGACPPRTGWTRFKLFPGSSPAELRRYCVYEFTSATGTPNPGVLPGTPSPDCNVVVGQAPPSSWSQANAPAFETGFFRQVERIAPLPGTTAARNPAKVMVVDSAPDNTFPDPPSTGQNEHGRVVGEVVRALGCPGGQGSPDCRTEVATLLALGLERDATTGTLETNTTDGGYVGKLTHTAVAIYDAANHGLTTPGSKSVFINLSLGWDGIWGGEIPPTGWQDLPAPVRAIFSAISYGGCQGAITIVAAGNHSGGPAAQTLGPMYPAAWEEVPAPSIQRCQDLGGQIIAPGNGYRPLLYAVGAVDGRDQTVMPERAGATPRLVAPAAHVAMTRVGEPHSPVYTGTSMATAVVSAIAATVAAYVPQLNGHEVMDIVYSEAVTLGHGVDFCFGSCPQNTRRASMCRAVAEACNQAGDCSAPSCGPPAPGYDDTATGVSFSTPAPTRLSLSLLNRVWVGAPCNRWILTRGRLPPFNACPILQYYGRNAAPHLVPQPIVIDCPSCGLYGDPAFLEMGISEDAPDDLSDGKLLVVFDDYSEEYYDLVDIPSGDIRGEFYELDGFQFDTSRVLKAQVEFVVSGQYAEGDSIIVLKK